MEFFPVVIEDRVKLGSVSIAKTDPIRRLIIGSAPLIAGLSIFYGLGNYILQNDIGVNSLGFLLIPIIYILFAISNTMFSSRKDLEGGLALFILIALIVIALYITGYRPEATLLKALSSEEIIRIAKAIDVSLLIPLGLNAVILGFSMGSFRAQK